MGGNDKRAEVESQAMPSPFPGMDPYLEGSEWTSVHTELSSEIARQLSPQLRPKYVARTTRRFVTEDLEDIGITTSSAYPDVSVFKGGQVKEAQATFAGGPPPLHLKTLIAAEAPQVTIEIRDVTSRRLVTAIEVLSPSNKRSAGYLEYLDNRQRLLRSEAHLIEIDLLRTGQRVPMEDPLPPAPYFVFLSRVESRPVIDVWPIQLDMPLPVVPTPLLTGDQDATLDLQAALNTIYDALNYDLTLDYSRTPEIPLQGEAANWAAELLHRAGFSARS
jgi:hypothetical protein